jgi:hypothetical protein
MATDSPLLAALGELPPFPIHATLGRLLLVRLAQGRRKEGSGEVMREIAARTEDPAGAVCGAIVELVDGLAGGRIMQIGGFLEDALDMLASRQDRTPLACALWSMLRVPSLWEQVRSGGRRVEVATLSLTDDQLRRGLDDAAHALDSAEMVERLDVRGLVLCAMERLPRVPWGVTMLRRGEPAVVRMFRLVGLYAPGSRSEFPSLDEILRALPETAGGPGPRPPRFALKWALDHTLCLAERFLATRRMGYRDLAERLAEGWAADEFLFNRSTALDLASRLHRAWKTALSLAARKDMVLRGGVDRPVCVRMLRRGMLDGWTDYPQLLAPDGLIKEGSVTLRAVVWHSDFSLREWWLAGHAAGINDLPALREWVLLRDMMRAALGSPVPRAKRRLGQLALPFRALVTVLEMGWPALAEVVVGGG